MFSRREALGKVKNNAVYQVTDPKRGTRRLKALVQHGVVLVAFFLRDGTLCDFTVSDYLTDRELLSLKEI